MPGGGNPNHDATGHFTKKGAGVAKIGKKHALVQQKMDKLKASVNSKIMALDKKHALVKNKIAAHEKKVATHAAKEAKYQSKISKYSKSSKPAHQAKLAAYQAKLKAHQAKAGALQSKHASLQAKKQKYHDKAAALSQSATKKLAHYSAKQQKYENQIAKLNGTKAQNVPAAIHQPVASTHQPVSTSHDNSKQLSKTEFLNLKAEYHAKLNSSEKSALLKYSGEHYKDINNALRKGNIPSGHADTVKHMDTAIAKSAAPKDMHVLRNVHDKNGIFSSLKPGDHFTDKGYVSTTNKTEGVFSGSIQMKILIPKGHPAAIIPSHHPHEAEVLLPRNSKLRVHHVEVVSGKRIIHMEVVTS